MCTETMTVHKALCELKVLESRIKTVMNADKFVFSNKHANAKVGGLDITAYCEDIKSRFNSVTDLMARRTAIKNAVVTSNANTTVIIAGKNFTVAEAIEFKNHSIPLMRDLLYKLNRDFTMAKETADSNNERLESRANDYIKSIYGNTDLKGAAPEIEKTKVDFIKAQTYEIVDPIKVQEKVDELIERIDKFMVDVDSALSVSNATTEITAEY